jgi:hypothetical protein
MVIVYKPAIFGESRPHYCLDKPEAEAFILLRFRIAQSVLHPELRLSKVLSSPQSNDGLYLTPCYFLKPVVVEEDSLQVEEVELRIHLAEVEERRMTLGEVEEHLLVEEELDHIDA